MSDGGVNFSWPIRVYYEDTDGGGVVYHANYLRFCERARTEWLRSLGYEQTDLRTEFDMVFVVRRAVLQYLRPARFNDALTVEARLVKTGRSLLVFEQVVWRGEEKLVEAQVEVVCVHAGQFKPMAIPEQVRKRIQNGAVLSGNSAQTVK